MTASLPGGVSRYAAIRVTATASFDVAAFDLPKAASAAAGRRSAS